MTFGKTKRGELPVRIDFKSVKLLQAIVCPRGKSILLPYSGKPQQHAAALKLGKVTKTRKSKEMPIIGHAYKL